MNRNQTFALLIVFGLLLIYVLLVQQPKDQAAAEATPTPAPTSPAVWSLTSDQITAFTISRVPSGTVTLAKDTAGVWLVTEPQASSADQTTMPRWLSQLSNLSASMVIPAGDLAQYGLTDPVYTIAVTQADGKQVKALVGSKTPTNSGYYVAQAGEPQIFVVSIGTIDALVGLIDKPPYPPPTATPTSVSFAATLDAFTTAFPQLTATPNP